MLFHGQPVKADQNRCGVIVFFTSGYVMACCILNSLVSGEQIIRNPQSTQFPKSMCDITYLCTSGGVTG